jgi:hypothetical protein
MCRVLLTIIFFIMPIVTHSQPLTRCQCTYENWVGDCQAKVELKGNWFKIISNTQQCSRVDWYIDGNPHVTIVTDGAEMEEWLGQSKSPQLSIGSCKVCKDSQYSSNTTPKNSIENTLIGRWNIDYWVSGGGKENYEGYLEITRKTGGNKYVGELYAKNTNSGNWARQRMDITLSGATLYMRGTVLSARKNWNPDNITLDLIGNTLKGRNSDTEGDGGPMVFSK